MKLNTLTSKTVTMTYPEVEKLLIKLVEKKTGKKVTEVQTDDVVRAIEFTFMIEPEQLEQDLDQPSA